MPKIDDKLRAEIRSMVRVELADAFSRVTTNEIESLQRDLDVLAGVKAKAERELAELTNE